MDWIIELRPEIIGWILTELTSSGLRKLVGNKDIKKVALHPNLKKSIEDYADGIDWDNPHVQLFLRSDEVVQIVSQLWRATSPAKTRNEIKTEFIARLAYELDDEELRIEQVASVLFEQIVEGYEKYLNEQLDNDLTGSVLEAKAHRRHIELTDSVSDLRGRVDNMLSSNENLVHAFQNTDSMGQIDLASEYRSQLAQAKQFLDDLRPERCLEQLEALHNRAWDKLGTEERYQILTYKAFAHFQMGKDMPQAAQLYIDALTVNPKSAKALANAALGYLIRKDFEKCKQLAEEAIQNDPTITFAYAMQAWGYSSDNSVDDISQKIPETYHANSDVATALGNIALQQGNYTQAEMWFRKAVNTADDVHPDIEGRLATVLIVRLWKQDVALTNPIKGLKNFETATLEEIIQLYSSALEKIEKSEIQRYRVEWLFNRATAYMWLEDFEQAAKDLEVAKRHDPDDPHIVYNQGIVAFRRKDFASASRLLEQSISVSDYAAEVKFWSMLIDFEQGSFADSELKAQQIISESSLSERWWEAQQILVYSQLRIGKVEEAILQADNLVSQYPEDPVAFIIQAYAVRFQGNKEKAKSILQDLLPMLSNEADLFLKSVVSQELIQTEMYSEAASILEEIVDYEMYTQLTHQLVYCHYRSGELQKALQLCQSLRKNSGYHNFLTNIEISIYEETRDLDSIKSVATGHLSQHPDHLDIRLSLAWNQYLSEEYELLDDFLGTENDLSRLPFEQCERYVLLLLERNFLRKAVQVAYTLRKQFFNNPKAHLLYVVGVFLRQDKPIPSDWYQHEAVEFETAVKLCDLDSENPKWFVISDEPYASLETNILQPNHPLAIQLMGKKVKEEVGDTSKPFGRKYKILEIKSKYIHALHESMQSFQTYFPDELGMMMFKVRYSDDEQIDIDKTFKPLFEMQRMQNEDFETVFQMYQKRTLPIAAFSELTGKTIIETFGVLINSTSSGIFCSNGTPQEKQIGDVLARSSSKLILDVTAIIAIHQLGLGDDLKKSFPELFVVVTAVDFLKVLSQRSPTHPMIKINDKAQMGKLFVFENEEQLKFNHDSLQKMIEWVEAHCMILPTTGRLLENKQDQIKLREVLGVCFLDTILAAKEQNLILYSDDYVFRLVADQRYGVHGIWSQLVLTRLEHDELISDELYELAVIELACLNYRYTAVNAKVLLRSARLSNWRQGFPLNRVWQTLSPSQSNTNTALRVATEFVYLLWMEKLPWYQYENLIMGIVTVITSSAKIATKFALLEDFYDILSDRFRLAEPALLQLKSILANWRRVNLY